MPLNRIPPGWLAGARRLPAVAPARDQIVIATKIGFDIGPGPGSAADSTVGRNTPADGSEWVCGARLLSHVWMTWVVVRGPGKVVNWCCDLRCRKAGDVLGMSAWLMTIWCGPGRPRIWPRAARRMSACPACRACSLRVIS